MNCEIDGSLYNTVNGHSIELGDREVLLFRDTCHHITQQVMAVNATDADTDGGRGNLHAPQS